MLDSVRHEPGGRARQGRTLHHEGEVDAHRAPLPFFAFFAFLAGNSLRP
jgi:hypothetical protein